MSSALLQRYYAWHSADDQNRECEVDRNFSLGQGVDDLHKLSQIAGSKQQLFETRHFSCAHIVTSDSKT